MQRHLFGGGEPAAGAFFGSRVTLSPGAWLEHHQGWLQGHERLFDRLLNESDWVIQKRRMYERTVLVPRLLGVPSAQATSGGFLRSLANRLSLHFGRQLDAISLAFYRDGNDSVAPHGDKMGSKVADTVIAIVSLGGPRKFLMKPATGGRTVSFNLGHGDLLVMGGNCQSTWHHGVPKARHAEPRISIMFRERVTDGSAFADDTLRSTEANPKLMKPVGEHLAVAARHRG